MKNNVRKKAALYTLDATLSILLAVVIIIASNGYLARTTFNRIMLGQPSEIGADVFSVFHKTGIIQSYYLQNEYFFNNTLLDQAGTSQGTYNGNAHLANDRNNNYDHRLSLDGSDSVSIYDAELYHFGSSTDFTISVWIKTSSEGTILAKPYTTASSTIKMEVNNAGNIKTIAGTDELTSSGHNVLDNRWHHIVWSVDRSATEIIYIDNVSRGSFTVASQDVTSTSSLILGASSDSQSFSGEIDDLYIYNKSVSIAEVSKLYQKEPISAKNLVSKFDFNPRVNGSSPYGINEYLRDYLPVQYAMLIELEDENGNVIANAAEPRITSVLNFIASGERVVAVNRSNEIVGVVKAKYYVWTK